MTEIEMEKRTILVIEDEPQHMTLMRMVLERSNYVVLEAQNAEDGLEKARQYHPDVILMDIRLPGMDGLEATRLIKSDPDLKDIPVAALSALAMQMNIELSLEAGCVGHISKPIDVRSFVDTMEKFAMAN